ncbi:MAG: hypothetical protein AAB263_20345, partial [Planctomycetota bacterium]
TVTLAAAEDADATNGTATITVSSAGLTSVAVTATEADNDTQSLVTSTSAVTVAEGLTTTFTVRLNAQPGSNTTVAVARTAGDSSIAVSGGASLTFTTANWATPQTVTLTAAEDVDVTNGSATITVSSSGLTSVTVTATETDNDTQALVVSAAAVSVPEGSTATFTVSLAYQPSANTTVTVTRTAGDSDVSVQTGSSLTFTSANYATPQTVTLAAAEDIDLTGDLATITVSSAGLTSVAVTATEVDNDVQGLVTSTGTVSVPEGSTANFTVRLNSAPGADTLVTITWISGDGDLTVSGGSSLTFTVGNWSTPQTVTLAAAADDDAVNGSAVIHVTSAGLATIPLTVTEVDDDTLGLTVSATTVNVAEGGTSSFLIQLSAAPTANTTVLVSRTSGDTDLDVSAGAALTFTSANWNIDQTVTLAAAQDQDVADGTAIFTASAIGMIDETIAVNELDDDTQALVLSTASVSVPEGATATFTVALAYEPTVDTTVTVARTAGDSDLSVTTGGSLIFTSANWSTPQTVTLGAAADVDTTNDSATITVSSTGMTSAVVTATEIDDDVLGIVVSSASTTVNEGGNGTILVRLNANPGGTATVNAVVTSGDSDITIVSGASLVFDTTNWGTNQTVVLAAAEDIDSLDGTAVVTLSAAGMSDVTVTATETDNDILGLVTSVSTLAVPEGATASFTVSLAAQPLADTLVTVTWTTGDTDLTVSSGSSLTFTTVNWATPQSVTIAAAEDADATNGTATISVSSSGLPTLVVTATETDNDTQALVVTPSIVLVNEGSTTTFSVQLAAAPAGNTVVSVAASAGDTDISVSGGASLTFTTLDWNTPQLVTLTAAQDVDLVNGSTTITTSSAGLTSVDILASEVDDDTQSLVVSPASVAVPEGLQSTFAVSLSYQPTANTVVTVAWTSGDSDLTVVGGSSLTFTAVNWSTPQTVTLAAALDSDTTNGSANISVSSTGLTSITVVATEIDVNTSGGGSGTVKGTASKSSCGAGALGVIGIFGLLGMVRLRKRNQAVQARTN